MSVVFPSEANEEDLRQEDDGFEFKLSKLLKMLKKDTSINDI